jgi:hypothetical protein
MSNPTDPKPLPDPMKTDDQDLFSLDDDQPLVCNRNQDGDKPCESCQ